MFVKDVLSSVKPSFKRRQRRPHSKPIALVDSGYPMAEVSAKAQEFDEMSMKYEALMKAHDEQGLKFKKLQERHERLTEDGGVQGKQTMEAIARVASLMKGISEKDASIAALKEACYPLSCTENEADRFLQENASLKLRVSQLSVADPTISDRLPQESQEVNSLGRGNSRIRDMLQQMKGSCQRATSKLESARALVAVLRDEDAVDTSILRHLPPSSGQCSQVDTLEITILRSDNAYLVDRLQSSQEAELALLKRAQHLERKLALTMEAYAVRQEVADYMEEEHKKEIAALKKLATRDTPSIPSSPNALPTPSLISDDNSIPVSPAALPTPSLISDDGSSTSGSPLIRPITPIMDLDLVSAGSAGLGAGSPVARLDVPPAGLALFDCLFPVDTYERISDEERCEALDLSACLGIPSSMPTFWDLEEPLARII